MFAYLQDSFAGTNSLTYHTTTTRRPFTSTTRRSTRPPTLGPVLTWRPTPRPPRPIRSTTKSPNFALPPLETTKMPHKQVSSTSTFGGVASNTMRPTTKSMLAEMEFPSNHDKPKYQFMHDPDKYKSTTTSLASTTSLPSVSDLVSIWNIIRTSTTTTPAPPTPTKQLSTFGEKLDAASTQVDFVQLSTKDTTLPMNPTTSRPNTPSFYPQLTQADPSQEIVQFPDLRPNFTMDAIATTEAPSTYRPAMDFDQFLLDHTFPLGTTTATLRPSTTLSLSAPNSQQSSNLSAGQWNQLLSKLNFALDKLSMLEDTNRGPTPSESKTGSFDILNNPQYLDNNRQPSSSLNGVKINVLSVDDNEYEEVNDPINYDDYFQAIADVDNLNLNNPHHNHPRPAIEDDYLYFNDDIIDKFFTFDIPSSQEPLPQQDKPFDLPGVGSRNPVPLSDFPSDGKREEYPLDLGKYPVQIPIPLTEAERLGLSVIPNKLKTHRPTNIGTKRKEESVSIGGKIRLAAPGVISEVFGPPANMTDM